MLNHEMMLVGNQENGVKMTVLQKPIGVGNGADSTAHVIIREFYNNAVVVDQDLEIGVPLVCYTPPFLMSVEVTKNARASFSNTYQENLAVSPVSGKLFFYSGDHTKPKYLEFCCSIHNGGTIG